MADSDSDDNRGSDGSEDSDGFETMYADAGLHAAQGDAESLLRDQATTYNSLDQDLTREQNAGDNEDDDDNASDGGGGMFGFGSDRKKKKKKKKRGEGDDEDGEDGKDAAELVEFFDFRRGPKHWPRGVELLPEDRARELIDKALEEANKKQDKKKKPAGSGKLDDEAKKKMKPKKKLKKKKKKDGGDDDDDDDEDDEDDDGEEDNEEGMMMGPGMMPAGFYAGAAGVGAISSDDELAGDPDDELLDPNAVLLAKQNAAPQEARFEYLRDRSTALLVPAGTRIKLDISGLTHDGQEKKAKAERARYREALMSDAARAKLEQRAKDKKKRKSMFSSYYYPGSGSAFDDDMWGDLDIWGLGLKNYVNEYTVTLDMRLKHDVRGGGDGLSLFQTSLVYVEENATTGRKTTKQSDGECTIGSNGGVGIFGQFGDVARAKLDSTKWRRVVVSVRNVADGKGEMRTWIDSVPCAVVKRDAFLVDSRFALDGESLYLFSSQKQSMMPGDVLVRTVRVQLGASTDETVKSQHAQDKVVSMFQEERQERAEEDRRGLSLARLFPKPRPLWMATSMVGAVGDPFIESTSYEGSSVLSWSYKVLHFALRTLVQEEFSSAQKFLLGFDHSARQQLSDVLLVMHHSSPAMNQMLRLLMHPNDSQVMSFISKLRKSLTGMQQGDSLLLPLMIQQEELLLVVERTTEQMFRFVVVETNAERGLAHHAVNPSLGGGKLRYRTCLVLSNIPKKNALDNVFWMAVYSLAVHSREGDLLRFYDVLLPFLTGKPLETSLWEAEEQALKQEEDGDAEAADFGVIGDWNSPQRSSTSYVRTLLHAVRYMLTSRGMSKPQCKQVAFALRAQLVKMMDNDLQFEHPDDNGQRVCRMACAQLSYSGCKLVSKYLRDGEDGETGVALLEHVKQLTDSVHDKLAACADEEVELPPQLDLRDRVWKEEETAAASATSVEEEEEEEEPEEDKTGEQWDVVVKHGLDGGNAATVTVKAHSTTSLHHLRLHVHRLTGVLPHEQRLIYAGRLLQLQHSTLASLGLKHGAAVQLMQTSAAPGGAAGAAPALSMHERVRKIRAGLRTDDAQAPTLETQFMDSLAWDVEQQKPNPGAAVSLRKYVPIDVLQMPSRVTTRNEAVAAIRLCDRIATLLDNQPHCVKNDRFLISSLVTYTFTQLVPVPKPRPITTTTSTSGGEAARDVAARLERRRLRHQARRERKQHHAPLQAVEQPQLQPEAAVAAAVDDNPQPDFARGVQFEQEMLKQACMWDADIQYELQVELLLVLQRLTEHYVASVFSTQQDRAFDGVVIVTMGCISALADAVMRRRATDLPSEACSHLMGQTRDGRQLGTPGYGISPSSFATQTETIEIHSPELAIARTRVLDYFNSPQQRRLEKIFSWERHFELKPDRELIKYLRAVQRETAHSDPNTHLLLVDGSPVENSLLKRNYPELRCYRDICFYWKCLMNPDVKSFPNWVEPPNPRAGGGRRIAYDSSSGGTLARFGRLAAQLHWGFEQSQNSVGYLVWCQFQGITLKCRPDTDRDAKGETYSKDRQPPTHRFPSTATPSFYVAADGGGGQQPIRTEDDVIYRPNLPGFEDDHHLSSSSSSSSRSSKSKKKKKKEAAPARQQQQQVLGQHDSELLISYLTVPYLRLPLVLTFFATDDRLHKLTSHKLRGILDSVLFEPGRYLAPELVGVAPTMVPTPHTGLLATPFGLLLNELARSPNTVLQAVDALLEGALALDTGSVCDLGQEDFNSSVDIILYVARLGARCESYVTFLLDTAAGGGTHECLPSTDQYRDLDISADCRDKLERGRAVLRQRLLRDFDALFEDYLRRLDHETRRDPGNERLISRNSRLAADLHAIKILFHRNTRPHDYTESTARALIGSFVFLTTRHTWNKALRQHGRLLVPETELYDVLQVQRRRLVYYCRSLQQGPLDSILQSALQISTSNTGSLRASADVVDQSNRWARIAGDRSVGRFAVGSTRTVADDATASKQPAAGGAGGTKLVRQRSYMQEVGEVPDSGALGVELDLQIGQMTLRSKHLSALSSDIATHADVRAVFGTATMQASQVERAQHRVVYRLVGLGHDVHYWHTPFGECPPVPDAFERAYDPSELFDSESWIPALFEPVRTSFFNGPSPPPMHFLMLARPLPEHAEVAVLVGEHQLLGGAFKLVYLFRKLRVVHVYEAVSHGRTFWWTLHLTTDARLCLRELQPSYATRKQPAPVWWRHGAGEPYPPHNKVYKHVFDDIVSGSSQAQDRSVVILRDAQHADNLSLGRETLVPARFLLGLVPQCLLDRYRFWRDESGASARGRLGYVRLLGYPIVDDNASSNNNDDEFLIQIELQAQQEVEICGVGDGGLAARTVRVLRRLRSEVERECETKRRLAEFLEQAAGGGRHLLIRSTKAVRAHRRKLRARRRQEADEGVDSSSDEDADGEEEDEEDDSGKKKKKKRSARRKGSDGDGENSGSDSDSEDVAVAHHDLFVGAVVEHSIRSNTWVECAVVRLYAEDMSIADVELRGDVHAGVVLSQVAVRYLRKKKLLDSGLHSDDDDDDNAVGGGGGGNNQNQQRKSGGGVISSKNLAAAVRGAGRAPRISLAGKGGKKNKNRQTSKADGDGIWHWEGISDSDDADWAENSSHSSSSSSDSEAGEGTGEGQGDASHHHHHRSKKASLSFAQIDQLGLLLQAAGGDTDECIAALKRLPTPPLPFTSVARLARHLARFLQPADAPAPVVLDAHLQLSPTPQTDYVLLNLLYAPKSSRLYSLVKALTRIENLSHICAWTKASNLHPPQQQHASTPQSGVPPIDLVELPRLKLSFTCRTDHGGVPRLYSLDHADLFVSNERNELTSPMLRGIPHSLLMCNTQGETSVLVPVVSPRRPIVGSHPFTTQLVLDRSDGDWQRALSQRYFIYPVHVSLSFLMSKGIDSGLYLLLLRFFHRDYIQAFRLADAIATDSAFSTAGKNIFHSLALANDDFHPDAHACRLKISLVTMDSGVKLPWDLTLQMSRYVTKLAHVSAECRISLEEELQLLETENAIAYEPTSPAYRKQLHTPFVRAIVRNRQQALAGVLRAGEDAALVSCYAPSRVPLSNWPNYVDNTVFGVVYEEMAEVRTADEWEDMLRGEEEDEE